MAYFVIINQVFAQIFQRILALYNLLILFWEEWTKNLMILVDLQKAFDILDHRTFTKNGMYLF